MMKKLTTQKSGSTRAYRGYLINFKKIAVQTLLSLAFFGLSANATFALNATQLRDLINGFAHGGSGKLTATIGGTFNTDVFVEGTVSGATKQLALDIGGTSTVYWNADYSGASDYLTGFIKVEGSGWFELNSETSRIVNTHSSNTPALYVVGDIRVDVVKGTIKSDAGMAINNNGLMSTITITGGTISTLSGIAIESYGTINIKGGTISATTGTAVQNRASGTINITGGTISATTGTAVKNGASSANNTGTVNISGTAIVRATGTLSRTIDNVLDGGGTINITGGTVENTATGNATAVYNTGTGTIKVSDAGIVKATGSSGHGIYNASTGNVTISGGTVQSDSYVAIFNYSTGKITVSGGKVTSAMDNYNYGTIYLDNPISGTAARLEITGGTVENTAAVGKNGSAIRNRSTGAVNVSGGTVQANWIAIDVANTGKLTISGTAKVTTKTLTYGAIFMLENVNCALDITGGTVESTSGGSGDGGVAICNHSYGKITVSGGKVTGAGTNDKYATIYLANYNTSTACRLEITGGTVENTGTTSASHAICNASPGEVKISNGMVLARLGYAIKRGGTGVTNLSDKAKIFAYGTTQANIINGDYNRTGNAVLIGWNQGAGKTTYTANSTEHIAKFPETVPTAYWSKDGTTNGIYFSNDTNYGLIPVPGVTVTGSGIEDIPEAAFYVYPNPTKGELRISNDELEFSKGINPLVIVIYDIAGKAVFMSPVSQSSKETLLDISHLPAGLYFMNTGKGTVKIVKQ